MKIEWWKLARRGAMAAIVACCVVGLTGCGGDEGDDADEEGAEPKDLSGAWILDVDTSGVSFSLDIVIPDTYSEVPSNEQVREKISYEGGEIEFNVWEGNIEIYCRHTPGIAWAELKGGKVDESYMSGDAKCDDGSTGTWTLFRP